LVKKASIDLGTNTCLLLIGEVRPEGVFPIDEYAEVIGLGRGVDHTGMLADDAMARAIDCLTKYKSRLVPYGIRPEDVFCVGTAQARDAKNAGDFFSRVERELGFRFRTLTPDEEARATFQGALLPGASVADAVVIDIGGGSTEIASHSEGVSLQIGAVRFTERFFGKGLPVTDNEFWSCRDAIDGALTAAFPSATLNISGPGSWFAVAGTATSLAQWYLESPEFNREAIESVELTRGDLHRMVEDLKWRNFEETSQIAGIGKKRADVILAGSMILWRTAEYFKVPTVRVSTRGLRYGILLT
jgi:exopolyphosphatase / guanosine-5'-triphosphate,3'-diphosphate pyrophosphatase